MTHLEFDLPEGDAVLDGRASAFDSDAPAARNPSCGEPDELQVQLRGLRELAYQPEFVLCGGIIVAVAGVFILRKRSENG